MSFKDLREFVDQLEKLGKLKRITHPIDPHYEMTEISDRVLRADTRTRCDWDGTV